MKKQTFNSLKKGDIVTLRTEAEMDHVSVATYTKPPKIFLVCETTVYIYAKLFSDFGGEECTIVEVDGSHTVRIKTKNSEYAWVWRQALREPLKKGVKK